MARASETSKRQEPQTTPGATAQARAPEPAPGWRAISELRWRPRTGQYVIFLSDWSVAADEDARPALLEEDAEAAAGDVSANQEARAEEAQEASSKSAAEMLPPLEVLRRVAERWTTLMEDECKGSALISFRVPGVLSPAELTRWLPGAASRLYTLGGLVAPLSDAALSRMPLARYSVVRAPNMSFWPYLRALIVQQEQEMPGMELWEDMENDLALLEQELSWWIARAQGLILNLYDGETLVGHLSLARQYDPAEGCDGWGVIALHIAPQARGQRLGTILQRVAATLLVTRKATRRIEPPAEPAAGSATPSETVQMAAVDTRQWPFMFGFVAAHNIPALRSAYAAGRRIIGTYVDVPLEALLEGSSAAQPAESAEG